MSEHALATLAARVLAGYQRIPQGMRVPPLEPLPRAAAVAATLRELAAIPGIPEVSLVELGEAYDLLGRDVHADPPAVAARRTTCRELAALCLGSTAPLSGGPPYSPSPQILAVWEACLAVVGEGPRYDAMRATAWREAEQLRGAAQERGADIALLQRAAAELRRLGDQATALAVERRIGSAIAAAVRVATSRHRAPWSA